MKTSLSMTILIVFKLSTSYCYYHYDFKRLTAIMLLSYLIFVLSIVTPILAGSPEYISISINDIEVQELPIEHSSEKEEYNTVSFNKSTPYSPPRVSPSRPE